MGGKTRSYTKISIDDLRRLQPFNKNDVRAVEDGEVDSGPGLLANLFHEGQGQFLDSPFFQGGQADGDDLRTDEIATGVLVFDGKSRSGQCLENPEAGGLPQPGDSDQFFQFEGRQNIDPHPVFGFVDLDRFLVDIFKVLDHTVCVRSIY